VVADEPCDKQGVASPVCHVQLATLLIMLAVSSLPAVFSYLLFFNQLGLPEDLYIFDLTVLLINWQPVSTIKGSIEEH
jgi:hypothetical protein